MRPSKAAIEAALDKYFDGEFNVHSSKMCLALSAAYEAQFGDETLYRIDYTRDKSDGAWVRAHTESLVRLGVLVLVEGDER